MCGAQVLGRANRHPVIWVVRRIERRHDGHAGKAVRTVLVVLPPLVQDDVALVLELGLGQRWQQVAHPVGFHPERQLQRVGRHDLPVVGAVGVCRPVQRPASLLQGMEVTLVVVLRPLEHQVFEEVGKPGAARLLVLGSDVIPDVDGNDRAVVILVDQNVQAVVESLTRVRKWHVGLGIEYRAMRRTLA